MEVIWGGQGGAFALLILKNIDFLVFLPTKFCIFHILPLLGSRSKFCPPLEKTEMTSLIKSCQFLNDGFETYKAHNLPPD